MMKPLILKEVKLTKTYYYNTLGKPCSICGKNIEDDFAYTNNNYWFHKRCILE